MSELPNIDVMTRVKLKLITKVQRFLLKGHDKINMWVYYKLAKLHFKLYFKKDLETETLNNSEDSYRAAQRHSRMVVSVIYRNSDSARQKMVKAAARGSFVKNIILNAKL